MANVLRGQIYVTKFDKKIRDEKGKVTSVQNGFRPALIIQNDTGNANSTTTIVFFRIKILLCVIGKEVIEKGDLYGNGNHAAAFKSTPCVYSKRNR